MRRIAGRLGEDNPSWIVLFGIYSRQFVAFPRFDVPMGTVVAARYPATLPPRMRRIESRALPAGTPTTQPDDAATIALRPAG
jgi:hypothetical protein